MGTASMDLDNTPAMAEEEPANAFVDPRGSQCCLYSVEIGYLRFGMRSGRMRVGISSVLAVGKVYMALPLAIVPIMTVLVGLQPLSRA